VTGIAKEYDKSFPEQLSNQIDSEEYQRIMSSINDNLVIFWPCLTAILLGYLFCPITFGLSLLLPK